MSIISGRTCRKMMLGCTFFHKTKAEYLNKMIEEGYITREEIIEKIGREKIVEFFHIMSTTS